MMCFLLLLYLTNLALARTETEIELKDSTEDNITVAYATLPQRRTGVLSLVLKSMKRGCVESELLQKIRFPRLRERMAKRVTLCKEIKGDRKPANVKPKTTTARPHRRPAMKVKVKVLATKTVKPTTTTETVSTEPTIKLVQVESIDVTTIQTTELVASDTWEQSFTTEPMKIVEQSSTENPNEFITKETQILSPRDKNLTSFHTVMETITKVKQNVAHLEETVAQMNQGAKAKYNEIYHNCALLIVNRNFTQALESYNRLRDKKSSVLKIVDITLKVKSSALFEVVQFIFRTKSEHISFALEKLVHQLMSLGQMHILNTLFLHKVLSAVDLNLNHYIKDVVHERLFQLSQNNSFKELYEYANDTGNSEVLNLLIPTFVEVLYVPELENFLHILNIYSNFSHVEVQLQLISETLRHIKKSSDDKVKLRSVTIIRHIQKLENNITSSKNENQVTLMKKVISQIPTEVSPLLGSTNCIKNGRTNEFLFIGLQKVIGKTTVVQKLFSTSAIYPEGTKKILVWSLFNITFADVGDSVHIKNCYFDEFIYINADGLVDSTKSEISQNNEKWYLEPTNGEYFRLKNVKLGAYLHSVDKVPGKRYRQLTVIEDALQADKWKIGSCQFKSTNIVSV